jgi:GNAT superfamily N-acetyltransferase/shikimate kinase
MGGGPVGEHGMTVRDARVADAAAVARLYVESWNAGLGDLVGRRTLDAGETARWARELGGGPQRWWVAERDGRPVGFVGAGPSRDPVAPDLGELDTIAVAPAAWRSGVGRALAAVATDWLAARYAGALVWTVAGYDAGRRFYEALGWVADGESRAGGREVSFRREFGAAEVVVLIGPPGSGKSVVGDALAARGLRWRDWEPEIVARWGSREAFVARKAEALPLLHAEMRAWIAQPGPPVVVETTGLSDAAFLDALAAERTCLVVRLDVTEDEALRRVAARPRGRHLTDDVEPNRAVWRAFRDRVTPHRRADLVVDTGRHPPGEVAALIEAALARRP